jgi:hypothetical protein
MRRSRSKIMEDEDFRAKLLLLAYIASICATLSLLIGGIFLLYRVITMI